MAACILSFSYPLLGYKTTRTKKSLAVVSVDSSEGLIARS